MNGTMGFSFLNENRLSQGARKTVSPLETKILDFLSKSNIAEFAEKYFIPFDTRLSGERETFQEFLIDKAINGKPERKRALEDLLTAIEGAYDLYTKGKKAYIVPYFEEAFKNAFACLGKDTSVRYWHFLNAKFAALKPHFVVNHFTVTNPAELITALISLDHQDKLEVLFSPSVLGVIMPFTTPIELARLGLLLSHETQQQWFFGHQQCLQHRNEMFTEEDRLSFLQAMILDDENQYIGIEIRQLCEYGLIDLQHLYEHVLPKVMSVNIVAAVLFAKDSLNFLQLNDQKNALFAWVMINFREPHNLYLMETQKEWIKSWTPETFSDQLTWMVENNASDAAFSAILSLRGLDKLPDFLQREMSQEVRLKISRLYAPYLMDLEAIYNRLWTNESMDIMLATENLKMQIGTGLHHVGLRRSEIMQLLFAVFDKMGWSNNEEKQKSIGFCKDNFQGALFWFIMDQAFWECDETLRKKVSKLLTILVKSEENTTDKLFLFEIYQHYAQTGNEDIFKYLQSHMLANTEIRSFLISGQTMFDTLCFKFAEKDTALLFHFLSDCLKYSDLHQYFTMDNCLKLLQMISRDDNKQRAVYLFQQFSPLLRELQKKQLLEVFFLRHINVPDRERPQLYELERWTMWMQVAFRQRENLLPIAHYLLLQIQFDDKELWKNIVRAGVFADSEFATMLCRMLYQHIHASVPPMDPENTVLHTARLFSVLRMLNVTIPEQNACFTQIVIDMVRKLKMTARCQENFLNIDERVSDSAGEISFRKFLIDKASEGQSLAVLRVLSIITAAQNAEFVQGAKENLPNVQVHLQKKLIQAFEPLDGTRFTVFKSTLQGKGWFFPEKGMLAGLSAIWSAGESKSNEKSNGYESDDAQCFLLKPIDEYVSFGK